MKWTMPEFCTEGGQNEVMLCLCSRCFSSVLHESHIAPTPSCWVFLKGSNCVLDRLLTMAINPRRWPPGAALSIRARSFLSEDSHHSLCTAIEVPFPSIDPQNALTFLCMLCLHQRFQGAQPSPACHRSAKISLPRIHAAQRNSSGHPHMFHSQSYTRVHLFSSVISQNS